MDLVWLRELAFSLDFRRVTRVLRIFGLEGNNSIGLSKLFRGGYIGYSPQIPHSRQTRGKFEVDGAVPIF